MRSVTIGNEERAMRVLGSGEPSLIFVHGFACASEDWDLQLDGLSARFRCVAVDLPGHGRAALPETASIEALAQTVNRAREEAGGGAAVLIGHSLGCRVVIEAYRQSPVGIAGLVLVDGGEFSSDFETTLSRLTDWIDRGGIDAMTLQSFEGMFAANDDPEIRQRIIARALRVDPDFRKELLLHLVRWDFGKGDEAMRQLAAPVLALQSTHLGPDFKMVPLEPGMTTPWTDVVAALVPDAEIKVIPGVGHFSMIEAASAVNAEIAKFATRFSRGASSLAVRGARSAAEPLQ